MSSRDRILTAYTEHVLEHGEPPVSVWKFAKALEIPEREFFEQFASFPAVEGEVWKARLDATVAAVTGSPEWEGFNARQRMLTFLFGFFADALDHRSFFLARFPCPGARTGKATSLDALKRSFQAFAGDVLQRGAETGEIPGRGPLRQAYPLALTQHFLSTIDFWLRDQSPRFERTDEFIEKSTALAFDLLGRSAFDSGADLVRFFTRRTSVTA